MKHYDSLAMGVKPAIRVHCMPCIAEFVGDLVDYPSLQYSMNRVRKAGKQLSGKMYLNDQNKPEITETFAIANNWIDSHAYPMRAVRFGILGQIRAKGIDGLTVARLKRMRSVRRKLTRNTIKLDQINDLAGCRAILGNIADVHTLIEASQAVKHSIRQSYDYIKLPKPSGYRSHHTVFEFVGDERTSEHDGKRVELQIRTRLQHSWATAVEAVGTFRNEDMKAGNGNLDWLRLFALMSSEFAAAEDCPVLEGAPNARDRRAEIVVLDRKLKATSTLENINSAVRFTESYRHEKSKYYLIKYDHSTKTVEVESYNNPILGTNALHSSENIITNRGQNNVLVEVDKIENLREAYPNYFGDVKLFVTNLKSVTQGTGAVEYSMVPQETVPIPRGYGDMSWLKGYGRKI